jgi:hypothetical protein
MVPVDREGARRCAPVRGKGGRGVVEGKSQQNSSPLAARSTKGGGSR